MFEKNIRFHEFRIELEQRGVDIRYAWQCRRDGKKPGPRNGWSDVAMLLFVGRGFQPSVLNAVAIDYGPANGFGLFIDDGGKIMADAERIATPRDTSKPHLSDQVAAAA